MSVFKLPGSAIQANTITTTQLLTTVVTQISAGGGPKVKSLIYPGNDSAANSTGGQTVYITGSGFAANAQVLVNGSAVPSQSFISASNISFTTPALSTGTYPVYVINPEDGGTAILYPGLLISGEPTWVTSATLPGVDVTGTWSISLSASGDTPITYALAAGNTLPSGITLSANGLISGTLSSPPGSETTYTFSVVATDAQNQDSTRQFNITAGVADVYFANNVLLIHADGTNNGNNHSFLDSSNNNFTITRNGNSTQGSFSPFSQTGWSAYFDGSGDYLTLTANSAFDFGTGDFTIECWINTPTNSNQRDILSKFTTWASASDFRMWTDSSTKILNFAAGNNNPLSISSNAAIPENRWVHIAVARSSGTTKLYIDGVAQTSTHSGSVNIPNSATTFSIGISSAGNTPYVGNISNLRILKGTALYTTNFTPSTSALTAVSNTSLLTCQSNRFVDNSTNAFTITRNGDVSIQSWSPFAPTAAYSTANVGGSGYFDGSDSFSISSGSGGALNFGSGDFTVESWIYPTISFGASQHMLFGNTAVGGATFRITDSSLIIDRYNQALDLSGSHTNQPYSWAHIAFVREGSTLRVYKNGVQLTSASTSASYDLTSFSLATGAGLSTYAGYFSGLRAVKGQCLYPGGTTFTVPTSPPTNVANTQFLCNFTNAQIFDQTAKNVLECIGDAKVSTAQYKYGTGSMVFDGTGDWLLLQANRLLDLSGDFTIETWLYPTATFSTYRMIIANKNASPDAYICIRDGNRLEIVIAGGLFSQTTVTVPQNSWTHLAVTRSGSSVKAFIDGTAVLTSTSSATWNFNNNNGTYIGRWGSGGYEWYGYMDDFRITNGYARYTANFTPPTSALKDK